MLKHNIFRKWAAATLFLLLWTGASLAQPTCPPVQEAFCFRHKVTDRIKTGCIKYKEKYMCRDDPDFKPTDEWAQIECAPQKVIKQPDVPKIGDELTEDKTHLRPPLESPKAKRADVPKTDDESIEKTIHLFRGCAPHQPAEKDKAK